MGTVSASKIWWDNTIKLILALVVLLSTMGLLYLMLTSKIPPENQNISLMVVTFLTGASGLVLGYFFGSSAGSAQKTAATLAPPPKP